MSRCILGIPLALCLLLACAPGITLPKGAPEPPPLTEPQIQEVIQQFANASSWTVTRVEVTGGAKWSSAYTDHWPNEPGQAPLLEAIRHLDGWEVTFDVKPKTGADPRVEIGRTLQVLVDRNRVIHWRKSWPALPPGLRRFGGTPE